MNSNQIHNDCVDPKDNVLVNLIKKCTVFLSADDEIQLRQKMRDLNRLYAMWIKDTDEGELF